MPSKLEYALKLSGLGLCIFRCKANRKLPEGFWQQEATNDPQRIKDWFICPVTQWLQDYNLGTDCGASGIYVIDVDCKAGKEGKRSYEELDKEHGFPETFTVKTPSGGLHLYYSTPERLANTTQKLAPGIDTRGVGGYVVAPGSYLDGSGNGDVAGEYSIIRDLPIAPMPSWIKDWAQQYKAVKLERRESGKTIIADHEDDVAEAVEFLQAYPPAVEHEGGDNHTYVLFCRLKERGLSLNTAIDMALEYWNNTCEPPWDPDDLVKKANSAYAHAQNATGAKSPHAEFEVPKIVAGTDLKSSIIKPALNLWVPKTEIEIPARRWAFGDFVMPGCVCVGIAPPGVGKSTFTIGMGLSKTTGRNLLGFDPHGRGAVSIFNNEDTMEEMERRIVAAMKHYNIPPSELFLEDINGQGLLYLNSGENNPLRIAKRMNDGTLKPDAVQWLIADLKEKNIKMFIADPLAETHPAQENSNEEMLQVTKMYRYVAQQADTGVVLIHHTRKLDQASSEGHSGNMDSARGASSLIGVARSVFTLNPISPKDVQRFGIPEERKSDYIVYEQAKGNMTAPGKSRRYFQRYGEILNPSPTDPDGESVGVLRPVKFSEKTVDDMKEPMKVLISDIEELVHGQPMTIPEIARELVNSYPLHADKNPRSLEKAITRLMSDDALTGFRGILRAIEMPIEGKMSRRIQLMPFEGAKINSAIDSII